MNIVQEQSFSDEEKEDRDTTTTTAEIKEMLSSYHKVAEFIKKKHSEKVHTGRLHGQFDDICLSHLRNILKSRQKKVF